MKKIKIKPNVIVYKSTFCFILIWLPTFLV